MALRAGVGAYGQPKLLLRAVVLYGGLLVGLVIIFWPFLWEAPLTNFLLAFRNLSRFYRWKGSVLYQGQVISGLRLPWHYAFGWISITTPPLYIGLFAVGSGAALASLMRRRWQLLADEVAWQDLFFLGLGVVPLVAVIVFHSVLYTGWRQLYFVYPPLLLVAVRGLVALWHWQPAWVALRRGWHPAVGALLGASLVATTAGMVRLHPFEHVYFNAFAPAHPERSYDADYWFMGTLDGLRWVLRHDPRPQVRIYQLGRIEEMLLLNRFMLPPAERARLVLEPNLAAADYALYPHDYRRPAPFPTPCYSVQAGQMRLLDVFCLRPAPTPAPRAANHAGE